MRVTGPIRLQSQPSTVTVMGSAQALQVSHGAVGARAADRSETATVDPSSTALQLRQSGPLATNGSSMTAASKVEQHARASLAAALSTARAEAAVHSRRADAAARRALDSEADAAALRRRLELMQVQLRAYAANQGYRGSRPDGVSRAPPADGSAKEDGEQMQASAEAPDSSSSEPHAAARSAADSFRSS